MFDFQKDLSVEIFRSIFPVLLGAKLLPNVSVESDISAPLSKDYVK